MWITGEPWEFTNWAPDEPNNSFDGTEGSVLFDHGILPDTGKAWNDGRGFTTVSGYVIEYENIY